LTKEKWDEWKRRQVEDAPRRERAGLRRLLADVPPPTAEQERAMKELGRLIKEEFGKGKGKGRA
jgi:hypothetical protein